jgi:serine/threonine-protein kinase HipA
MRGLVYNNGTLAGVIEKDDNAHYLFRYDDAYFADTLQPPVSLTLPKSRQEYRAEKMFPFFYGLLSEGINKDIQCRLLKIDENDDFTRLLLTAGDDTIGSVTVKPEDDEMFRML